ncbi:MULTISPECIES: VOC family protein [Chryseobacterium]|uniref:VOC family protein n=1 Tax=Chryseobacterium TaxID=59732 RepID=UPI0004E631AF|nr:MULTISPECIES: VOC family protein [Chryseobacterium]KFF73690.1 glyoxalase [Chryseobacterium sp. P1-3]MDV3694608.1 glyoxalase/bleomycin resistance/dioxygenase family protein [Elizabethkingia anophelis]
MSSTNSNFRGIDHIGITVPDIDEASAFLEKALDAKNLYDVLPKGGKPFEGEETEKELGIPKASKIVHMRLIQIGNGPTVELFQFADAPQENASGLNDYGLQHIAVYVDDINAACRQFEAAGGKLLSPPHPLANVEEGTRNKGVYGRAPWGTLIELLTYPDRLKDKSLHRWTPNR